MDRVATNFGPIRRKNNKRIVNEKREEKLKRRLEPALPFNFIRDVNNSQYLCPTCQRSFLSKHERDTHMTCHNLKKCISKHIFVNI